MTQILHRKLTNRFRTQLTKINRFSTFLTILVHRIIILSSISFTILLYIPALIHQTLCQIQHINRLMSYTGKDIRSYCSTVYFPVGSAIVLYIVTYNKTCVLYLLRYSFEDYPIAVHFVFKFLVECDFKLSKFLIIHV